MGKTMVEKIFERKSKQNVTAGTVSMAKVDFAMMHDVNTPFVIDAFGKIEDAKIFDTSKVAVVLDHFSPTPSYEAAQRHKRIETFANGMGLRLYRPGEGICHQLMIENGHVTPGHLVVATDSHTCTYGALNALGISVGATEMAVILASGVCWFRVPESIYIDFKGSLQDGVSGKDVSLEVIRLLSEAGGVYKCLEFGGEGLSSLSIASRVTICNMASEVGVKSALMPCDEVLDEWLTNNGLNETECVTADPDATYVATYTIDLSDLKPKIARSPSIDDVLDVSGMEGISIQQVVIGSCTNGNYEDFEIAARLLKGRKVEESVRLIVVPASKNVLKRMMHEGLAEVFLDAGAMILPPGCGPCAGLHGSLLADGETALSTTNRNVRGRMGSKKADVHIVSPATAAASAVTGKITSPDERIG
jgi:3-isopropylmalate/(R)-2-methylmalate dehydratase large subunit